MNVARLNFSHGDFPTHKILLENLRRAERLLDTRVTVMADLPGPKIRIGKLTDEPFELHLGDLFTLTTNQVLGDNTRASVTFDALPRAVKPGNVLFLNDGLIQLEVVKVTEVDVVCRVVVGGELRSRKGLNLPGIDLGISAFTKHDRACLRFAIDNDIDAVSQSFVESKDDIMALREAALSMGRVPFIIAKIERSRALDHIDEILEAADGIMIARGDLGVEIPIETIALVQKQLTAKANLLGKPVITATHMLESMTENRRPTRAEATDVANAILDGTDCVMLSGESAMGKYPVDAVRMLAKIAEAIEPYRPAHRVRETIKSIVTSREITSSDLISLSVESALERMPVSVVVVRSHSGTTARRIARLRLPVWLIAPARDERTCHALRFSYGVFPFIQPEDPPSWSAYARTWVTNHGIAGNFAILIEGPSPHNPHANHKIEIVELRAGE